jgi:hypothetical protein
MREIGIDDEQPTTMYQDCQPAIKIAEGRGPMGARTKCYMHGHRSIQDPRVDLGSAHQAPVLSTASSKVLSMTADLGTKSLSTKQFIFRT